MLKEKFQIVPMIVGTKGFCWTWYQYIIVNCKIFVDRKIARKSKNNCSWGLLWILVKCLIKYTFGVKDGDFQGKCTRKQKILADNVGESPKNGHLH